MNLVRKPRSMAHLEAACLAVLTDMPRPTGRPSPRARYPRRVDDPGVGFGVSVAAVDGQEPDRWDVRQMVSRHTVLRPHGFDQLVRRMPVLRILSFRVRPEHGTFHRFGCGDADDFAAKITRGRRPCARSGASVLAGREERRDADELNGCEAGRVATGVQAGGRRPPDPRFARWLERQQRSPERVVGLDPHLEVVRDVTDDVEHDVDQPEHGPVEGKTNALAIARNSRDTRLEPVFAEPKAERLVRHGRRADPDVDALRRQDVVVELPAVSPGERVVALVDPRRAAVVLNAYRARTSWSSASSSTELPPTLNRASSNGFAVTSSLLIQPVLQERHAMGSFLLNGPPFCRIGAAPSPGMISRTPSPSNLVLRSQSRKTRFGGHRTGRPAEKAGLPPLRRSRRLRLRGIGPFNQRDSDVT